MVSSLEKAGIKVKPNRIEVGQYYSIVFDPEKAGQLMWAGWGPDWPNASTVIPELFTPAGGFNLSQVDDKAFTTRSQTAKENSTAPRSPSSGRSSTRRRWSRSGPSRPASAVAGHRGLQGEGGLR